MIPVRLKNYSKVFCQQDQVLKLRVRKVQEVQLAIRVIPFLLGHLVQVLNKSDQLDHKIDFHSKDSQPETSLRHQHKWPLQLLTLQNKIKQQKIYQTVIKYSRISLKSLLFNMSKRDLLYSSSTTINYKRNKSIISNKINSPQ